MDAELKAKWIAALRSGEYRQARGTLWDETVDGYCCLGVLLHVQGYNIASLDVDARCTSILPSEYSANLPFDDASRLAHRNDGSGDFRDNRQSFEQIADYIEQNL